ncbi:MAG: CocE/NonD family hydrolase [bacterium]|nr:CocE/NonD family hydrolase [bacterium]
MKRVTGFVVLSLGAIVLLQGVCVAQSVESTTPRMQQFVQMVAARDGVQLWTKVFLPNTRPGERFPVIVDRSPYLVDGSDDLMEYRASFYTRRGYAWVTQACRGTHHSEGEFVPYRDDVDDGGDLVEWVATQDWADLDHLGAAGCSYEGFSALAAAIGSSQIRAVWTDGAVEDESFAFHGGLFSYDFLSWIQFVRTHAFFDDQQHSWAANTLDLASLDMQTLGWQEPMWQTYIAQPNEANPVFDTHGIRERWHELKVPVLFTGSREMTTQAVRRGLMERSHESTRDDHRYIIIQGTHCDPSRAWGREEDSPEKEAIDSFLDKHLLGLHGESLPKIQYRAVGDEQFTAISHMEEGTEEFSLFLDSSGPEGGTLSEERPLVEGRVELMVDPDSTDPCQEAIESLTFVSEPLEQDLVLFGEIQIELWGSSSRLDADFFVGVAYDEDQNIAYGGARARYRHGFQTAQNLVPGKPTLFSIKTLREQPRRIPQGSRIHVSIYGHSCFYLENPHTGERVDAQTQRLSSVHRVYTGPAHTSRVIFRRVPPHETQNPPSPVRVPRLKRVRAPS